MTARNAELGAIQAAIEDYNSSVTAPSTIGAAGWISKEIARFLALDDGTSTIYTNTARGRMWALARLLSGGSLAAPVAAIATDSSILPTYYSEGNDYFPTLNTTNGYHGMTTYEGYAPWPVYFSGWGTTNHDIIQEWKWDFGSGTESDYGGRYFYGINAAHLFETAGTYTVTLTVTDYLGRTSSDTRTVTVHAAGAGNTSMNIGTTNAPGSGTYALTTYYIDSAAGNDSWDGKSSTFTGGSNGPWASLTNVYTNLTKTNRSTVSSWNFKPGDKVLLKAGDTYTLNDVWDFSHGTMAQGIHFGKWSTGANPIIRYVTPGSAVNWTASTFYALNAYIIAPAANGKRLYRVTNAAGYTSGLTFGSTDTNNCSHRGFLLNGASGVGHGFITFTDIEFKLADVGVSCLDGLWKGLGSHRNLTFARCTIRNPFNTTVDWEGTPGTNNCYGLSMFGCTSNQDDIATASIIQGVYGGGTGLALIGSTWDRAGNHIHYLGGLQHGIISDNVCSRPAYGRTALRITGSSLGTEAQYIHITRNKFLGWVDSQSADILDPGAGGAVHNGGGTAYNFALVGLSHNVTADKYINNVVFEENILTNYEIGLQVINHQHTKIRNNLFVTPSTNSKDLVLGDYSSDLAHNYQMRVLDDIEVLNNTFIHNGSTTASQPFIIVNGVLNHSGVALGSYHTGIKILNNLAISVTGHTGHFLHVADNNSSQVTNMTMDYNLLDSSGTDYAKFYNTTHTLASWQSTYSKDAASLKTTAGVVSAPTGTSHASGAPTSQTNAVTEATNYRTNFQLSSTSVAINAGTTAANVWSDLLVVDRPVGGEIDIGAFEYPTIVTPPVNALMLEGSTGFILIETGDNLLVESGAASTIGTMTAASTLTGTETIAINQGSSTVKLTIDDLKTFIQAP